ncbi:MAG: hypothetical protein ABIN95_09375, partial [Mucilaginibacter sp.]
RAKQRPGESNTAQIVVIAKYKKNLLPFAFILSPLQKNRILAHNDTFNFQASANRHNHIYYHVGFGQ